MYKLTSKTVVITGAAGGLGRALAVELHKQGCHLALVDVNATALQQFHGTLGKQALVTIHTADVGNEENLRKTCTEIINLHGKVDVLINNAAISISQPFEQLDLQDYHRLMDVNF